MWFRCLLSPLRIGAVPIVGERPVAWQRWERPPKAPKNNFGGGRRHVGALTFHVSYLVPYFLAWFQLSHTSATRWRRSHRRGAPRCAETLITASKSPQKQLWWWALQCRGSNFSCILPSTLIFGLISTLSHLSYALTPFPSSGSAPLHGNAGKGLPKPSKTTLVVGAAMSGF